jgi:hypothetical protein
LFVACSSSTSNDFFEQQEASDSTSSSPTSASTSASLATTTGGTATTDGTSGTSTTSAASASGGSDAVSTSDGSGTVTASGAGDPTTSGGTGGETSTSGASQDAEVVTVDIELEAGSDCVEVSCPSEAPFPVECDITFSQAGPLGVACIAQEPDGSLYVQSGIACGGSQIEAGAITCSSREPDEPLSTVSCVAHDKPNFAVVQDRCDCQVEVPGCAGFGLN